MTEQEFKVGIEQMTHVSEENTCDVGTVREMGTGTEAKKERKKELRRIFANPIDKFKFNVGTKIKELNEDNILNISSQNRNFMCNKVNEIDIIGNLNPLAFILGFMITNGGEIKLDIKNVKQIFEVLNILDDDSVERADVIRYGRYWLKLNDNL